MERLGYCIRIVSTVVGAIVFLSGPFANLALSQTVEEFYKGRTIHIVIGYAVGGGYDAYARLLTRYMGKHIPGNPNLVPQNMPGAGSLKAALFLYEVAPKDGSYFGTVARAVPLAPLLQNAQFDGSKFSWIGSISDDVSICLSWNTSPVKTFNDMLTQTVTFAGEGAASDPDVFSFTLNNILGTKINLVTGYQGTSEIVLAMERGEIHGICGMSLSTIRIQHPDWIREKRVNLLLQIALKKDPQLPDVPLITELAKTPEQEKILRLISAGQAIARPFFGPPGMPEDRKRALQDAFDKTMQDPEFLAEAKKMSMDVHPLRGGEINSLLLDLYATPKDIVDKAARAIVK
jgi:tripartite-type tricarboxylate transporter receptor subunit TctC